jgi:hypothetical protein
MNTGIKLLAGVAIGGLIVFLYLKYKKTPLVQNAAPGSTLGTTTEGSGNVVGKTASGADVKSGVIPVVSIPAVKDPVLDTAPVKKDNINYGGTVIHGYVDGVNPNLVINDPAAYIREAVASGNVKKYDPNAGLNPYADGDVVESQSGELIIVRY